MLPWIRGWGADVEVVRPVELRNEIKAHVASMATMYEVANIRTDAEPFRLLWAKADRKTGAIHRLVSATPRLRSESVGSIKVRPT